MAHKIKASWLAGGQALVVADGAPVLAGPGEGPLDHPAAGQDRERRLALFGAGLQSTRRRGARGERRACAFRSRRSALPGTRGGRPRQALGASDSAGW